MQSPTRRYNPSVLSMIPTARLSISCRFTCDPQRPCKMVPAFRDGHNVLPPSDIDSPTTDLLRKGLASKGVLLNDSGHAVSCLLQSTMYSCSICFQEARSVDSPTLIRVPRLRCLHSPHKLHPQSSYLKPRVTPRTSEQNDNGNRPTIKYNFTYLESTYVSPLPSLPQ